MDLHRAARSKPAAYQTRRASRVAVAALALGVTLSHSEPARACGPCGAPEFWQVEQIGGEPVVISNFGLLAQGDTGWRLTCEESIGGLLLDVHASDQRGFVSTDSGLFAEAGGLCDWGAGPASPSNDWLLSYSMPAPRLGAEPTQVALVLDFETQEIHVERSEAGDEFSVINTFGNTSGYRDVEASDADTIFVSGYTFNPRTWNVAYSLDSGDSWEEVAPSVENESVTMRMRLVDPDRPRAVFAQAETLVGEPDELWLFDAEAGDAELLLTLDGEEIFGGIALDGDTIWVAGRHRDGGSLYRADREDLEFAQVTNSGPEFSCLAAFDDVLYACVANFTYSSRFVLGGSTDDGETWTPLMTLDDLGTIESCGDECAKTVEWLHSSYGIVDEDSSGPDDDDGGCQFVGGRGGLGLQRAGWGSAWPGLLLGVALWRRRSSARAPGRDAMTGASRRRSGRMRRVSILPLLMLLGACSSEDGNPDVGMDMNAGTANCNEDLRDLELASEDGSTLTVVDVSPDPPAVGDNSWLVELATSDGDAMMGMGESIVVTPFMPDHGHGTSVSVGVAEEGEAQYRLSPVNLRMPGWWQVSVEVESGSTQLFELDVCVQ